MAEATPPGAGRGAIADPRLLRDLIALLALPAFWNGREPAFVLRTFFEALEPLLDVALCYVDVPVTGTRCELLRLDGHPAGLDDAVAARVRAFVAEEPRSDTPRAIEVGSRRLTCVRWPIGYAWDSGCVVVGAARESFPDPTEQITLRAAISLAASGLETSRLLHERDEAQRAKDEFLAMLGHELRNPLNPIVMAVQLLTARAGPAPSRELEIIDRQVRHLKRLVDDLLDVSRVTRGTIDLKIERLTVEAIVERALETAAPSIEEGRHAVTVEIESGLVIDADAVRMTQVVTNLLSNAAKFTPRGGRIRILGSTAGDRVVLRVIDTGTGLSADFLPRVFDLFVQGRRDLARTGGGLGLGLAIVKQLVAAHGGKVSAHSDGPGLGSEFVIELPRALGAGQPRPDSNVRGVAAAARRQRILIVDDNQDAADMAATVLSGEGHEVDVAYTGKDALERVRSRAPDVVVLDLGLPDLDGFAVAGEISGRHRGRTITLIALTGYGREQDRQRTLAAGFAAHLVKPVDPIRLANVIAELAASRSASQG